MARRVNFYKPPWRSGVTILLFAMLSVGAVQAQTRSITTLKQAFEAAWARQPEALAQQARRDAIIAKQQVAESWLAEPPTLEISTKTDQLNQNLGRREVVTGIALPLWLPGESRLAGQVADAELRAEQSRVLAAQLRLAWSVREVWWNLQRAQGDRLLAQARLTQARALANDVARRVKVGDLARADQHQAQMAVAGAEIAVAEAEAALSAVRQSFRPWIGVVPELPPADSTVIEEPLPAMPGELSLPDPAHPAFAEWQHRADAARRSVDLASAQTRANPELTLSTAREQATFGDPGQQTITLGLRIPFGSDSRNRAKVNQAQAEAIEAESRMQIEREQLLASLASARIRVDSVRAQLAAAEKRAELARETRGFFDKSFRLGETDLPTRLRVELDTVEAERVAIRTRIDLAAAISGLRQALGLLPETP